MTVASLLQRLEQLPPEMQILVEYDSMMEPLHKTRVVENCLCLFHIGYGSEPEYKDWTKSVKDATEGV